MSKVHYALIEIDRDLDQQVWDYLHANRRSAFQSENETITVTAEFDDGNQADIKCCGCQDAASWTEMVLFNSNGMEICCTDPDDRFTGRWEIETEGETYVVDVIRKDDCDRFAIVTNGTHHALIQYVDEHLTHDNVKARLADAAMDFVASRRHFIQPFTLEHLLTNCTTDIYEGRGFVLTRIDIGDPAIDQFKHIEIDPNKSLINEEDFTDEAFFE